MRDVHLLGGLFLGPLAIVFALSAILLNHPSPAPDGAGAKRSEAVRVPAGIERLEGMERVRAARQILDQLGLSGEIGFVGLNGRARTLTIPVTRPGWEFTVRVDLERGQATVETRRRGLADRLHWLHKLPGPHLANIRGNWILTRLWRWFADATVYLLLAISATGVYLWALARAERKAGLALAGAGAVTLIGMVYALAH